MTDFNTDYNTTELLDQELTTAELSQVSGGCDDATNTIMDPGFNNLPGVVGEFILKEAIKLVFPQLPIALWSALIFNFLLNTCSCSWVELLVNY